MTGLLLLAPPASALSKHVFSASITGSGSTALTNPTGLAVDPQTEDIYVTNPEVNQRQAIAVDAAAGTFTLAFAGQTTAPIKYGASPIGTEGIQGRLEALPNIGKGNVAATNPTGGNSSGGPYTVEFIGALAGAEQPQLTANPAGLLGGTASVAITISRPAEPRAQVEKFTPSGEFLFSIGSQVDQSTGAGLCTAASGHQCRPGLLGATPGAFTNPSFLAVDPTNGDLYVGDTGDNTVTKYDSSGNLLGGWQAGGQLSFAGPLQGIAVDAAGDLFVLDENVIYRYQPGGSALERQFRPEASDKGYAELNPFGLAIDREDHLYGVEATRLSLKFNSLFGEFIGGFFGHYVYGPTPRSSVEALALDPASNDLYLLESPEGDLLRPDSNLHGGNLVKRFAFNCPESKTANGCPLLEEFGAKTIPLAEFGRPTLDLARAIAIAPDGTAYVADTANARVAVFPSLPLPELSTATSATGQTALTLNGTVDPGAGGEVTECQFEYGEAEGEYNLGTLPCEPAAPFGGETEVHADLSGLTPLRTYHFRLLAASARAGSTSGDRTFLIPLPPQVGGESANEVTADSAAVHAEVTAGGGPATYRVEYLTAAQATQNVEDGEDEFAGAASTPSLDGGSAQAPEGRTAHLGALQPETAYRYRVIVENALEALSGAAHSFATLPFAPYTDTCPNAHVRQQTGSAGLLDCRAYELVSAADAGGYDVESDLIPGQQPYGGYPEAQGRVLYGVHDGGIPGTDHPTNRGVDPYVATRGKAGWSTEYVGVPANNPFSVGPFSSVPSSADANLETFAFGGPEGCSPCFEGGYTGVPVRLPNGELAQGMAPGEGVSAPGPSAVPDGKIAQGLSANGEHFVFGSASLFAAGGNDETGDVSIYDRNLKTGQTHVVSNAPTTEDFPAPLACLQGAGRCDSAEGDENGLSELAISKGGSRILLGQKVSEDAEGNVYWHLYMDVNDSISSVDLTPGVISEPGGPGFAEGALFDGMTADGSKVFFTTADQLLGEDEDESPDIYEASLNPEGTAASLRLVSTGTTEASNSDACDPVAGVAGPHWNALGAAPSCGALAIGGGGGVATADGAIYFLSPEDLTESATCGLPCANGGPSEDQPNLYLANPGEAPRFIATLLPSNPLVVDALSEAATRHTADFQATPSGGFAAFGSTLALAGKGEQTGGHVEVYRYDASSEGLLCASCTPSGGASSADSSLASEGLSLTDDGRLFFDSSDPISLADTDAKRDAYEWEARGQGGCGPGGRSFDATTDGCLALISAGTSSFDSGLLSVSADGTDAYFFTRDRLVPQDENGSAMKIYDAREGGGFPYLFPEEGCKASDECHGAGSPQPPQIENGVESGTPHNFEAEPTPRSCPKGKVRRHGVCVRRPHKPHPHKHKHSHKHHRRAAARRSHRARSSVVFSARGQSRAVVASAQSQSGSSASRAKAKHLRGGRK